MLSRPADRITVADIVTSIEGPIAVTECVEDNACEHEGHCGVRGNWQRINQAIAEALASVTLADMTKPPGPKRPVPTPLRVALA